MVTTATVKANSVAEAIAKVNAIHKAFGKDVEIDLAILADETDDDKAARLGYAFTWLKNNQKQELTIDITGAIEFNIITDLTKPPQKVASAASAIETAELTGASYKPIMYVGTQIVRGVNYWFICEQTIITAHPKKKIVKLAVNEFQGEFKLVLNATDRNKPETIFE